MLRRQSALRPALRASPNPAPIQRGQVARQKLPEKFRGRLLEDLLGLALLLYLPRMDKQHAR